LALLSDVGSSEGRVAMPFKINRERVEVRVGRRGGGKRDFVG